jgi:hypothetical protein
MTTRVLSEKHWRLKPASYIGSKSLSVGEVSLSSTLAPKAR